VVDEAIDERGSGAGVGEDGGPIGKREIGSQDEALLLIAKLERTPDHDGIKPGSGERWKPEPALPGAESSRISQSVRTAIGARQPCSKNRPREKVLSWAQQTIQGDGMKRSVLILALCLASGCSFLLNFHECNSDSDCTRRAVDGGAVLYCTSDNACVAGLPDERLCTETRGPAAGPGVVTFAALARLDGTSAPKDNERMNAVRMAADEVNQQMQPPIHLVICNTSGDPTQALRALKLATTKLGAAAIIGPTNSPEMLALADSIVTYQTLAISGAATSDSISHLNDHNLIWRTVPADRLQAPVLASLVTGTKPIVDIAYANTVYGLGLDQAFSVALYQARMLAPTHSIVFEQGSGPVDVVNKLSNDSPNFAALLADSDAPPLVAALAGGGTPLAATQYIMPAAAESPALLMATSDLTMLARVRGTGTAIPTTAFSVAWVSRFKGMFGSDPASASGTANFYDAFYAVAIAAAVVPPGQKITGPALAGGMAHLSNKQAMPFNVGPDDFTAASMALRSGMDIDLKGVSGDIDFDPHTGDVLAAPIEIWSIDVNAHPPQFHTDAIVDSATP
jgi:branched-chain amino acid transport system substrate-binding protein